MITVQGRTIIVPEAERVIGVQNDNKSESRIFTVPRYYNGIDLSQYAAWLCVESSEPYNQSLSKTYDDTTITLEWIITRQNTLTDGRLKVSLKFVDAENDIVWNTYTCSDFLVRKGINANAEAEDMPPDMLEQAIAISTEKAAEAEEYAAEALESKDLALEAKNTAISKAEEAAGSAAAALESEENAAESATIAGNNILNGVTSHNINETAHPSILQAIQTAENIARGKSLARVFDTYADMTAWLAIPENTESLNVGDNLYIRDLGVKDYWWDGTEPQVLEAEAPDLTDYYTKEQVNVLLPISISRSDYIALETAGTIEAGRTYDIWED